MKKRDGKKTPAQQHHSMVKNLLQEKDQLIDELKIEREAKIKAERELEQFRSERLHKDKDNHKRLLDAESLNRQLEYELKKYMNVITELEDRNDS